MYYGNGYAYGMDWSYLLLIGAFILSMIVQFKMQSTFGKYSRVATRSGMTGAQVAQMILQSEGLDLKDVVKTTVFLSDIANFGPMNEIYAEFFTAPFPARCAFAVKDLPKGALVEIELIAEAQ